MIFMDPACNFYYSSYYIYGIRKVCPSALFSSRYFRDLKYGPDTHCFAFIQKIPDGDYKKFVIDFADSTDINDSFYTWADVYGKINSRSEKHKSFKKLQIIPPGFAMKIHSKPMAGLTGLINYLKSSGRTIGFYIFISKYLMSADRYFSLDNPDAGSSEGKIFFVSTYWHNQESTNRYRADFIRACREIEGIDFEGGLIPESLPVPEEYRDVIIHDRFDYPTYIRKTLDSSLVFNTPAYHSCHGWKLPEYLAMGKAIISTPFTNDLAKNMEHGKNIYFTEGSIQSIREAVIRILKDQQLKTDLEKGAREYFREFMHPEQVITMLLSA